MQRRDLAKSLILAGAAVAAAKTANAQTAPAAAPSGASRLAEVLRRGTLRIGTTGDFNPMSFRNTGSNEYTGFDIEAMTQFAADLGVKTEWIAAEWATLVAGIAVGVLRVPSPYPTLRASENGVDHFKSPVFSSSAQTCSWLSLIFPDPKITPPTTDTVL